MANNILKTRIILNNKTKSEWESDTYLNYVPLKGELCIYSDSCKLKIGDGTTAISKLIYINLTPEEIQALIDTSTHEHLNIDILNATTASFTTALLTKLNGIATGATNVTVDSSLSSTSTNPVQNKVVNSALSNKVPTSRTVNGKALSSNITLDYSDVGADKSGSANSALSSAKTYSDTNLKTAKSYTDTKVAALVDGAPETMDTLKEVADAIAANDDVVKALNSAIGNKVDKASGKGLSTNDYTTTEKNKLSGIASGAEVNQNAFSNVVVGETTVSADSKTDTLTLAAGSNVTITPDATNDKITISATNTTYCLFKGATSSAAGENGLVPAPTAGNQGKFLKADGTWATPTNTTYGAAGADLGLVKTGGDVAISSGVITVNDNSHAHTIANVTGLQSALDGKAASSHGTHVTFSATAPSANGTASVGTATTVSRSDHVHPLQTSVSGSSGSCTGNAASATKLATARNIGITGAVIGNAASFNGTENVNITATSVDAAKLTISTSDTLVLDGTI
jgi:hypothetical protein